MRALLQTHGSKAAIQVDGGITPCTLPAAYDAGARRFVCGSAVFGGKIAPRVAALRRANSI